MFRDSVQVWMPLAVVVIGGGRSPLNTNALG